MSINSSEDRLNQQERVDDPKKLQAEQEKKEFNTETQRVMDELEKEKEGFLDLFKGDTAEDQQKAKEWYEKRATDPIKAFKLKQDLAVWKGAKTQANEVVKKTEGLSVAEDKIKEIWDDKDTKPAEKTKQFDALYKASETHKKAETAITRAKLAPKRKALLKKQLADLWETEDAPDIEQAINDEIFGALDEHKDTGEKVIEQRADLNKKLEESQVGGVGLFSKAEIKAQKKDWSKKIFKPFYTGKPDFIADEKLVFKMMKEAEKNLAKEITERKKITSEFVDVRKVFSGLQDKKADRSKGPKFGNLISPKKWEKSSKREKEETLQDIVKTAQDFQFQSPYGAKRSVTAGRAGKAFKESMSLSRWQEKEETKFTKKEMPKLETQGLVIQDWSEAHVYFSKGIERLEGFIASDMPIVQTEIAKWKEHRLTCEREMMADVNTLEQRDEYTDQEKAKIDLWQKNSDSLKGKNDILAQKVKNLAIKIGLIDQEEQEIEAQKQAEGEKDIIETIQDAGAETELLTLAALNKEKEGKQKKDQEAGTRGNNVFEETRKNEIKSTLEGEFGSLSKRQENYVKNPDDYNVRKRDQEWVDEAEEVDSAFNDLETGTGIVAETKDTVVVDLAKNKVGAGLAKTEKNNFKRRLERGDDISITDSRSPAVSRENKKAQLEQSIMQKMEMAGQEELPPAIVSGQDDNRKKLSTLFQQFESSNVARRESVRKIK